MLLLNFKENLSKKLLLGGNCFHMRCCVHILNIIVQARLKYQVKGFSHGVPTMWNSIFDMLQSALTSKEVFARYADSNHYDSASSADDWNKTEVICKFLKYF
ncbi:hypothetical protein AMTRI_Chr13g88710 [Amborella trichopoda]